MALAQLVTRGYSTGSNDGTVNLVVVRGYGAAAAAAVVVTTGAGGMAVGRRRQLQPLATHGARAPVSGDLYRQMFQDAEKPVESTTVERTDMRALLVAYMAGFDE